MNTVRETTLQTCPQALEHTKEDEAISSGVAAICENRVSQGIQQLTMPMDVKTLLGAVSGELYIPSHGSGNEYISFLPKHCMTPIPRHITTDSREVREGSVFVAICGDRFDGHKFLEQAYKRGAGLAIVSTINKDVPIVQILVKDTIIALGDLARCNVAQRRALNDDFTVIAVTGSVGKTTTKDLLKAICSSSGETVAPIGSFNNEIGLPLTCLTVGPSTRYLVVEMGANHRGEIAYLTSIVPPNIAIELKVGLAHVGEFGSVDAIAAAKYELLQGLLPGGTAILNAGDDHIVEMSKQLPEDIRVSWFADQAVSPSSCNLVSTRKSVSLVYAHNIADDDGKARYTMKYMDIPCSANEYLTDSFQSVRKGENAGQHDSLEHTRTQDNVDHADLHSTDCDHATKTYDIRLGIHGKHNVANALAACAAAKAAGISLANAARVLSSTTSISAHRMEMHTCQLHHVPLLVIDDAFNANPDSMHAGLTALGDLKLENLKLEQWWQQEQNEERQQQGEKLLRVAILGVMLELGEDEEEFHLEVGKYAAQAGVNVLIAVGGEAALGTHGHTYTQIAQCYLQGFLASESESSVRLARLASSVDDVLPILSNVLHAQDVKAGAVLIKGSHASCVARVASALTSGSASASAPASLQDTGQSSTTNTTREDA